MTQAALARALGVTFQQVQKYEKGINRVAGERLMQICRHLEVTPDYFAPAPANVQAEALEHFVQSPEGMALYRAHGQAWTMPAPARQLITAVTAFSDSIRVPKIRPSPKTPMRRRWPRGCAT